MNILKIIIAQFEEGLNIVNNAYGRLVSFADEPADIKNYFQIISADNSSNVTQSLRFNNTSQPVNYSTVQHNVQNNANLDNLIQSKISNSSITNEEEEEFMRKLKNTDKCADGRYRWRKQKDGKNYYVYDRNKEQFIKKVSAIKKLLKSGKFEEAKKPKESDKIIDLCWTWYKRYKQGKIKSDSKYESVIRNYISVLNQSIANYNKDSIQDFLNDITTHRNAAYCYDTLKNVFADAAEKGLIKNNYISNLKRPPRLTKKGRWINLDDQKTILANLEKCKIGKEILFYLMTGCRCSEALNATINFDRCVAFVDGTKTLTSTRYINLSPSYCEILKQNWSKMFKYTSHYYSEECSKFFKSLGIQDKTLHSTRHTFSSNLYYLGIPDVKRQYLMGHASIVMTNDIYTTLDPTIKNVDITALYGNLYPEF